MIPAYRLPLRAASHRWLTGAGMLAFAVFIQAAFIPSLQAATCVVPAAHRAWGGFAVGSWKKVEITDETFDAGGKRTGRRVTETKTTLVEADNRGYTLLVEAVVVVANRRMPAKPHYVRRSFNGEFDGQKVEYKEPRQTTIEIKGTRFASQMQQYTVSAKDERREGTVYYNGRIAPFILRRRIVAYDTATDDPKYETSVEVISVSEKHPLRRQDKLVSHVKTTYEEDSKTIETDEYHSSKVPGAVVEHISIEKDEAGKVRRSSKLELKDYGIGDGRKPRRRIFFPNIRRRLR